MGMTELSLFDLTTVSCFGRVSPTFKYSWRYHYEPVSLWDLQDSPSALPHRAMCQPSCFPHAIAEEMMENIDQPEQGLREESPVLIWYSDFPMWAIHKIKWRAFQPFKKPLIFKSLATGFCSHRLQNFGQRTKTRKGWLEQVGTDKGGEQESVRAEKPR